MNSVRQFREDIGGTLCLVDFHHIPKAQLIQVRLILRETVFPAFLLFKQRSLFPFFGQPALQSCVPLLQRVGINSSN